MITMQRTKLEILRGVDLFNLLPVYDPTGWQRVSKNVIVGVLHDSCKVTLGKGWYWFSRNQGSQNPIDFLMRYYGLNFKEAVHVIDDYIQSSSRGSRECYCNKKEVSPNNNVVRPPVASERPWHELLEYLTRRRYIMPSIVDYLVKKGLVYQTAGYYANACFINLKKNHWEVVGMHPTRRYRQVSDASNYWAYALGSKRAYICESAIDAISLYELLDDKEATYISIAGSVTRAKLIKKVVNEYSEVILAVDNDDAGNKIAAMYPNLRRIIPQNKDFNDDLTYHKKG